MSNCPDCGISPGASHKLGCDVARCTGHGIQYLRCADNACWPTRWTGEWPGALECREWGWYTVMTTAPYGTKTLTEDLNRLYVEYAHGHIFWDVKNERFIRSLND